MMIKSLTELLKPDETLRCSVFGVLTQNKTFFKGFFGFSENALLIALVQGEKIISTNRFPLEIHSISVRRELLGQYIINISFNDHSHTEIKLFSQTSAIKNHKDNVEKFLDILSELSPEKLPFFLKDVVGTKIRMQHFILPISFAYFLLASASFMFILDSLKNGFIQPVSEYFYSLPAQLIIFSCILVFLINRFLVGITVCVINEKGLYFDNKFVPWDKIKSAEYIIEIPIKHPVHRSKLEFCRIKLILRENMYGKSELEIEHFPLYAIRKIKKMQPQLKVKNKVIPGIIILLLTPIVLSFILAFCI